MIKSIITEGMPNRKKPFIVNIVHPVMIDASGYSCKAYDKKRISSSKNRINIKEKTSTGW